MEIGKNIKQFRLEKGVKQEDLADHLGLSYQAVSKWECETNTPDISLLPRIAEYFGVTIDELFFGKREDAPPTPSSEDIRDDGVIRIVQMIGQRVIKAADIDEPFELIFPKDHDEINVEIFGSAEIDGDIKGNVTADGYIECGNVGMSATADGYIDCGNVGMSATADGYIECGNVGMSATADGYIECGNVGMSVTADGYIECGSVNGNVSAGGDVECGEVRGNVTCNDLSAGNIYANEKVTCSSIEECETITCKILECAGDINCDNLECDY